MKLSLRKVEVRTSVAGKHLDDLRVGVKGQSSLAMSGSCRNIPWYSLVKLVNEVKLRNGYAGTFCVGILSNSELINSLRQETGLGGKLLVRDSIKRDYS